MNQEYVSRFLLIQGIRKFFEEKNFLDVLTPPVVSNPGMETHIHPFQIMSAKEKRPLPFYLHTSPEFYMKELLSKGLDNFFTIAYCFRDEPSSSDHRFQFIMLEWYRQQRYEKIMSDVEELFLYSIKHLLENSIEVLPIFDNFQFCRKTVAELFFETLNIDILDYSDKESLRDLIESRFPDVPLPSKDSDLEWDDYYFLLFLNKIEPTIKDYPFLLLYEFPAQLSALSTLKKDNPLVCERFEVYSRGIEICNCFNELLDIKEQQKRFQNQAILKEKLYNYTLPEPKVLYSSLERGLPLSSGIALGVERLLKTLTGTENPFWD